MLHIQFRPNYFSTSFDLSFFDQTFSTWLYVAMGTYPRHISYFAWVGGNRSKERDRKSELVLRSTCQIFEWDRNNSDRNFCNVVRYVHIPLVPWMQERSDEPHGHASMLLFGEGSQKRAMSFLLMGWASNATGRNAFCIHITNKTIARMLFLFEQNLFNTIDYKIATRV